MRNLIKLAIAYQIALVEADVKELGYNVDEEDFKGYFEITSDADARLKDSSFDPLTLQDFMNEEEIESLRKESNLDSGIEKEEVSAEETNQVSEEIQALETELLAKKEALETTKNANSKKKLQKEIEVLESEISEAKAPAVETEKEAKAREKAEAKAAKDAEKAEKAKAKEEAKAAKEQAKKEKEEKAKAPKETKQEKWVKLVEEFKDIKAEDKFSFVDYQTKETIVCNFKKHDEFGDHMPAARVEYPVETEKGIKNKSRLVSYRNLVPATKEQEKAFNEKEAEILKAKADKEAAKDAEKAEKAKAKEEAKAAKEQAKKDADAKAEADAKAKEESDKKTEKKSK